MNSVEKVASGLVYAQDLKDSELREAVPLDVPVPMIRMALAGAAAQLPTDVDELDRLLESIAGFALSLRSDDAPLPTLSPADGGSAR